MGKSKGRSLNPADAYRKQQKQRERGKNKKLRSKMREHIMQTKDVGKLQSQLDEIHSLEAQGQLDKKHKAKKKALQETLLKLQEYHRTKEEANAAEASQQQQLYQQHYQQTPQQGYYPHAPHGAFPAPPPFPYPGQMTAIDPSLLLPAPPPPPPEEEEDAPLPDDEDEEAPLPDEPPPPSFAPAPPSQHMLIRQQQIAMKSGMPYMPIPPPHMPPPHMPPHSHAGLTPWSVGAHQYPYAPSLPVQPGGSYPPSGYPSLHYTTDQYQQQEQQQPPPPPPPPVEYQDPAATEEQKPEQPLTRNGFIRVPTSLKVKRANTTTVEANSKPVARVDVAAAALVTQAMQAVNTKSNLDEDFSKYMEEMQALGAL